MVADEGQRQPNDEAITFERLVTAAREGDTAAIAELVDGYRPYLLKLANQDMDPALRGKLGASDVVQETLITAHRCLDDFAGESEQEWKAWLRGILANDVQHVRRKYRGTAKRQLDREVGMQANPESSTPELDIAKSGRTPSSEAAINEEAILLQAALGRLSSEYRQVIQLRNWEQLSFDEIGERIGRSAEAARKLWSRAVARLQQEIGDDTA